MTSRLSADDWAAAALDALADGGVPAVAVEPIALRLGATKGSFYWHFRNRQALVEAALARWAQQTEDTIERLDQIVDPEARMRTLLEGVMADTTDAAISFRLISAADDSAVGETARRVTERRLAYLQAALEELGLSPELARRRVLAGYGAYLGLAALRRIGAGSTSADFIDQLMSDLTRPPS
ncbi:TetR/AcrR family transcriptional regulator [Kribbella sp. CA-247076]|uniref:TetR/AcrR family transcriptional regulator n=1 Tax=Kribbella sp. CA-247076 TaxID=3239941 RepID=UPI003D8F5354